MIGRTPVYFITCYTVLKRPNKVETAVRSCNSRPSVWTHVVAPLSFLCCYPVLHRCYVSSLSIFGWSDLLQIFSLSREWLQTELDNTKSSYNFIIYLTKSADKRTIQTFVEVLYISSLWSKYKLVLSREGFVSSLNTTLPTTVGFFYTETLPAKN